MKQSASKKYLAALAAATTLVGGTAAAAVAFNWTASGNGSGSAHAHTQTINITATTPAEDPTLYPGNANGSDVTFKIDNANLYEVTVTNVVANGAVTSDTVGCAGSNVTFLADLTGALNKVVPATTTGQTVTLAGNLKMSSTAANACQGATFSIPITVTDTQSAIS